MTLYRKLTKGELIKAGDLRPDQGILVPTNFENMLLLDNSVYLREVQSHPEDDEIGYDD